MQNSYIKFIIISHYVIRVTYDLYINAVMNKIFVNNFMERRDMKFFGENEPAIKVVTQRLLGIINFLLEVIKNKEQESQPKYRLEDIIEIKGIWYCKIHVVMTNIVNDYLPVDRAKNPLINGAGQK